MAHKCTPQLMCLMMITVILTSCGPTRLSKTQELCPHSFTATQRPNTFIEHLKPAYAFSADQNHPSLLFCTFEEGSGGDRISRPVILSWRDGEWQTIDFEAPQFEHYFWVIVACARTKPMLWGIMEFGHGDPGEDVRVVFSADGGRTWQHIASIAKPYYMSYAKAFRMDSAGHGSLVFHLDDEYSLEHAPGYYTYTTIDWGKTWSYSTFSGDILEGPDNGNDSISASIQELLRDYSGKR